MKRKLISAAYIQDIQFETVEEMEDYLIDLQLRETKFKVLETFDRDDQSVIIRVLQQHSKVPLILFKK